MNEAEKSDEPSRSDRSLQEHLAEVVAVGDELTSGQRLDTNSQWLSARLSDVGARVAFHTTVGDDLEHMIAVIRTAMRRADIVVLTGGLGPTKDDLTRQAIADAADVELEFHESIVEKIRSMFARFGREMPETNRIQAFFPSGSSIIDNPEGTAPGIDFVQAGLAGETQSRLFALPGVPYEMKQMWESHVEPAIALMMNQNSVIHHHVLRCFGVGESQAEMMLPDMMRRDREPRVGITASKATISFRISARGSNREECLELMHPTIQEIRETMGEVVFGENDETLHGVVQRQLKDSGLTIAVADFHFGGHSVHLLQSEDDSSVVAGHLLVEEPVQSWVDATGSSHTLADAAIKAMHQFNSNIGIAIGPLAPNESNPLTGTYHVALHHAGNNRLKKMTHAGHSSMRDIRSAKHVLNFLRLYLLDLG
ncbi:MAG: CinA family nicotinamide mononucleotide deamidase-related protein [Planctomycetota bacterium]